MALTDIPFYTLGKAIKMIDAGVVLDAAEEKTAYIMRPNVSKTITHICYGVWITTTAGDIECRLETVVSGLPSGILIASGAEGSRSLQSTDDYTWLEDELTTPYNVTAGDQVAVVLQNPAGSSANWKIMGSYGPTDNVSVREYCANDLAGAGWAVSAGQRSIALKFSDGSYYLPINSCGCHHYANFTINTGATPEQVGNRFRTAKSVRCIGFMLNRFDCDYDVDIKLISGADTAERSVSLLASERSSTGSVGYYVNWPTPIELDADTYYRIAIYPQTVNSVGVTYFKWSSEALMLQGMGIPTGWEMHATSAKDPTVEGDWTNYNNGTDGYYMACIYPIFDQMDFGGGGGRRPRAFLIGA